MKKILHLSLLSLGMLSTTGFAISCPPTKMIEEKIKNFYSTIEHEGLQYHLNHSDFDSKTYNFSQTKFAGAELNEFHKAPGGTVVSCHYKTFDGKNGEIVLESNNTSPKTVKPEGHWALEEGVHACEAKKDAESGSCSFSLIDNKTSAQLKK